MKFFTIIIVFLTVLTINDSYGQSFQLLRPVSIPDTLYGKPEQDYLKTYAEIKNITSDTIYYKIAIAPNSMTPGHLFAICNCETCYLPTESYFETPSTCVLVPNATSGSDIYLDLIPNNTIGNSIININMINVDNPSDKASYQAIFMVGTVDVDNPITLELLPADVIPNPASDRVFINNIPNNYSDNSKLDIFDSKGNVVNTEIIPSSVNEFELKTSNYISGVYYYNITVSGKPVKTGSFVISK